MQDRYVGDVGDFGKYALLRRLVAGDGKGPARLGVVWYKHPDEGHNGDGRHVAYLERPAFTSLDPDLHRRLAELVHSGRRSIAEVERSGVLPDDTDYHAEVVTGSSGEGAASARRLAHRTAWLRRAVDATARADVVFLDPDNGIATSAAALGGLKDGKYVFLDEIVRFWRQDQSLVVYHHLNRLAPNVAQVAQATERLADALGRPAFLCPVLLRRGSCRVFWVLGQARHAATLKAGVEAFLSAGWDVHCDLTLTARCGGPTPP